MSSAEHNGRQPLVAYLKRLTINSTGWGPTVLPEQFQRIPYQEFDRFERIGRVADWTVAAYRESRRYGNGKTFQPVHSVGDSGAYAYFQDDDDVLFKVVNTKLPRPAVSWGARNRQGQHHQSLRAADRVSQQPLRTTKSREKDRHSQLRLLQRQMAIRQRYTDQRHGQVKPRQPSVTVKSDWELLEDFDLTRMQTMRLSGVDAAEDIDNHSYGMLEYYDRAYDRLSSRNELPLQRINRVFFSVTTTDDPIIEKLSTNPSYTVFGTDILIATLMTCTRSIYSWDMVVHRVGNKLFFDKRSTSNLDYPTVSETAIEPPQDEGTSINTPSNLAMESMYINQNFSQQVLKMGGKKFCFQNERLPYFEEGESSDNVASKGYRYRTWDLGNDITLVCRCEHDGVKLDADGKEQFLTIKAFNEWDHKLAGGIDWRTKIDTQRGAILATELKNNSCKLAKWTVQALLAGSQYIVFGYVSRIHPRDSSKHVLLAIQQFKTTEFVSQINLNMDTSWGILRCIIDKCLALPQGKYLLMKNPNLPSLHLYKVPLTAFDDEEEADNS